MDWLRRRASGPGQSALFAGVPGLKDRLNIVLPSREVTLPPAVRTTMVFFPSAAPHGSALPAHGKFKAAVAAFGFRGVVEAHA